MNKKWFSLLFSLIILIFNGVNRPSVAAQSSSIKEQESMQSNQAGTGVLNSPACIDLDDVDEAAATITPTEIAPRMINPAISVPSLSLAPSSDTGVSNSDQLTGNNMPTFEGQAAPGQEVYIFDGNIEIGKATSDASGDWNFALAVCEALLDGKHAIKARASNGNGVYSPYSSVLSLTIDTDPPAMPSIDFPRNGGNGQPGSTITISGHAGPNLTIMVMDRMTRETMTGSNSQGRWSVNLTGLTAGTHIFRATAVDAAGNESPSFNDVSVIVNPNVGNTPFGNNSQLQLAAFFPAPASNSIKAPAATKAPARTPTATRTPTRTPTSTLTPTRTPTATSTASPTATNTPTSTNTASPSPTATDTPTATATASPTVTNTSTSTSTASPTATDTPTATATALPTATDTPTVVPANTALPTAMNTPTAVPSDTASPTAMNTPIDTETPTDTPTFTAAVTDTPTFTATATHTPTINPTDTPTDTPTSTPTNTVLPTETATPMSSATSTATNTATPTATTVPSVVIVAAGDIACGTGSSGNCQQLSTSNLMVAVNPDIVIPLGDNQYECGGLNDFNQYYDPTWGRLKGKSFPAIGNHEYQTSTDPVNPCYNAPTGAPGYFTYFGSAATPNQPDCAVNCGGYYSYDVGAWHIIVLNSICSQVGGCGLGSPEEIWLKNDLAAHSNLCTLAYWHYPRYTSGLSGTTFTLGLKAFWQDLYNGGADVILNGHDHDYERFAPMNVNGNLDTAHGIREFVIGTGGKSYHGFITVAANSEVRFANTFGVMKMTLNPTSYNWQFIPVSGGNTDSGSENCR